MRSITVFVLCLLPAVRSRILQDYPKEHIVTFSSKNERIVVKGDDELRFMCTSPALLVYQVKKRSFSRCSRRSSSDRLIIDCSSREMGETVNVDLWPGSTKLFKVEVRNSRDCLRMEITKKILEDETVESSQEGSSYSNVRIKYPELFADKVAIMPSKLHSLPRDVDRLPEGVAELSDFDYENARKSGAYVSFLSAITAAFLALLHR